jgi:transcriptional regulator with GAF, ATPase, and Fis domain
LLTCKDVQWSTQPRSCDTREDTALGSTPAADAGSSRRSSGELLGTSDQMREVRELIGRVADTDVTVLVRGESGTGKELVARAVHDASPRRERTFVKVNCAALPGELLESELFGFERGAFTGAIHHKPGKFEFANHGTMFLDEISEMRAPLQSKLLQVLQDGEFARLGGRQDVRVDVRVVAATNRDLEGAVAEGQFREDLFFRLNVVCITLPPLRQRRDEIPVLTEHFLRRYSEHYNKPVLALATDTIRLFVEYDWPGNVRELENLIKRMVILGSDTAIRRDVADAIAGRSLRVGPIPALQPSAAAAFVSPVFAEAPPARPASAAPAARPPVAPPPAAPAPVLGSLKDIGRNAAREAERELIFRTLQQTRWNRREAAEILGISYKALLYKIKEAELDKAS